MMETTVKLHPGQQVAPLTFKRLDGTSDNRAPIHPATADNQIQRVKFSGSRRPL
jgi:hypothetical protein